MAETRIAFLCKAASTLPSANINKTQEIIKSYYMMRCKEISKGYGLPQKYFSKEVRCSHCCLEWSKGSETNVKAIKISKRQRKRIKSKNKLKVQSSKEHLLHSNELERICDFCKHSTKIAIQKPNKKIIMKPQKENKEIKTTKKSKEKKLKKNTETHNVYNNTVQVFSLNNKKRKLKSQVKEEPKVIKNNKKRKDKFAGLCQRAVLASAKLKQENDKQNKLNLFLKPVS